jgi:hypothetical protein
MSSNRCTAESERDIRDIEEDPCRELGDSLEELLKKGSVLLANRFKFSSVVGFLNVYHRMESNQSKSDNTSS